MKTKILIISLISILIFSCKSDDESTANPTGGKLVTHMDWGYGEYIDFEYFDDRTIKSIDIDNYILLYFQYSAGKIETMLWKWGPEGETFVYDFTYDADGKINSFTKEGELVTVTYDAAEESYTYEPEEDAGLVKIFLEGEDVYRLVDDTGNNPDAYTYNYADGDGALAGTNAVSTHIIMALPDPVIAFMINSLTKKPLITYQDGDEIFEFNNQFDENGLLIRRDYFNFNDDPVTDILEYTQF